MRLYFLVMYNLSGIQKGIQAGHAALEYAYRFAGINDYQEFITRHKTWIILDGGGSNEVLAHAKTLEDAGIRIARFYEPDLNNACSAVAFLVPEKVYGPDPSEGLNMPVVYDETILVPGSDSWLRAFIKGFHLARN